MFRRYRNFVTLLLFKFCSESKYLETGKEIISRDSGIKNFFVPEFHETLKQETENWPLRRVN